VAKDAASVDEYINALPEERRKAVEAVRDVILANLPKGYEEGIQYGMIGYFVPLRRELYPLQEARRSPPGRDRRGGQGLPVDRFIDQYEDARTSSKRNS
jgi:hypothetical protein